MEPIVSSACPRNQLDYVSTHAINASANGRSNSHFEPTHATAKNQSMRVRAYARDLSLQCAINVCQKQNTNRLLCADRSGCSQCQRSAIVHMTVIRVTCARCRLNIANAMYQFGGRCECVNEHTRTCMRPCVCHTITVQRHRRQSSMIKRITCARNRTRTPHDMRNRTCETMRTRTFAHPRNT